LLTGLGISSITCVPDRRKDLTTREAAAILGVSVATLVVYANKGYLVHYRLPSGHRRYRRQDVEELLPHQKQPAS